MSKQKTTSNSIKTQAGKGLGFQRRLKPKPPPRSAKAQPTYTKAWINYLNSQLPPSEKGLYHRTFS